MAVYCDSQDEKEAFEDEEGEHGLLLAGHVPGVDGTGLRELGGWEEDGVVLRCVGDACLV